MKLSNCKEFYYWIFFPFSLQFCIQFIDRVNVYILFCIFTIREGMDLDFFKLQCYILLPSSPPSLYLCSAVHQKPIKMRQSTEIPLFFANPWQVRHMNIANMSPCCTIYIQTLGTLAYIQCLRCARGLGSVERCLHSTDLK